MKGSGLQKSGEDLAVKTDVMGEDFIVKDNFDGLKDLLANQNPVGRTCQPSEVAALVVFLCSTQAAFINGELICMDGGRRDYYWGN